MYFESNVSIWRKKYWIVVLVVICIVGAGLRSIHHSDWLIFQSDQSRDAIIVNAAVENGLNKLPLLGPQARGSNLHLGPFFYYLQYSSAKLFGQSPESLAYPDLFFGILTVPLLFFLLKRFLSREVSLYLTALASVSLFLVTFSRFAWNPNSLPFFTTAFILCFLSAIESSGRRRWLWLAATATMFGIITNLHFVPAIGLAGGLFFFLILVRSLKWQEFLFCVSIIMLFQLPILINEMKTGGATTQSFIETVDEKGYQNINHNLLEKIFRAYQEESRIVWLIVTGQQNTDIILTRGFSFKCDEKCNTALPYSLAAIAITAFVMYTSLAFFRDTVESRKRKELLFLFLLFGSFFIITILLAYQISTRFYLGVAPLLFVFFGLSLMYVINLSKNIHFKLCLFGIGLILFGLNFSATAKYLSELSLSQVSAEESGKDLVFGTEPKVTLDQLRTMADETQKRFSMLHPVFISGESRYARSLYYILSVERGYVGCYLKGSVDEPIFTNHIRVIKNKQETRLTEKSLSERKEQIFFGTLALEFVTTSTTPQNNTLPKECLTY